MQLTRHRSTFLLLSLGLFAVCHSASLSPFSSEDAFALDQATALSRESVCAQSCTLLNKQVSYQPGQTYVYKVDLNTRLAPGPSEEEQQVKIVATADVAIHSQCEFVLKLRNVRIAGLQGDSQVADQLTQHALHFAYEDGSVVEVCASPEETQWVVDIKKAIISALQMSSSDISQTQTVLERDISGMCETVYEPLQHDSSLTIMRKSKSMDRCTSRQQLNVAFFPRNYAMNQLLRNSLPLVHSNASSECTQVIRNDIVESVTCEERQRLRQLAVQVNSHLEVQLIESKPTLTVPALDGPLRRHRLTLASSEDTFVSTRHPSRVYRPADVEHLLQQVCSHVVTSVQRDVPVLFHELVQSLHSLTAQEQSTIWEQIRTGQVCHGTHKLVDLFLDASALAGNEGSVEVLIHAYETQQITRQRANYLFGLLAFAKHPTVEAAQRLVTFVTKQHQQVVHLPRGILFGITGFVHNLQTIQQTSTQANPAVDALVESFLTSLLETIHQLVPHVSTQAQQQQVTSVIYALRNLVLIPGSHSHSQIVIAQQLVSLLQQVPVGSFTGEVRVALVRTLVNTAIDEQSRQYLLERITLRPEESLEVRIEAYRAIVLSGATQGELQRIKQYTEQAERQPAQQQFVNYIRSHQANLRTTSDPHKRTILPINAPAFAAPASQWIGISRNYELSYVNEAIGLGVTAETDIIYDPQSHHGRDTFPFAAVPQTLSFNLTIPIAGSELQLVEVRLHQHGLEPLIGRHLQAIQRDIKSNDPVAIAKETLIYLYNNGANIIADNPQVHILIQLTVDGKTILLVDEHDLANGDASEDDFLRQLASKLHAQVTLDRAFAITPLDTVLQFPSVSGLPVQVRLNSTFVVGLKADVGVDMRDFANSAITVAVYPSVASQIETAVSFTAGPERKSVEYVTNFYSAPQVNLVAEVSHGRLVSIKIDAPEERYTIARIESAVYTRNHAGERVRVRGQALAPAYSTQAYPNVHICSQLSQRALGVALCYDFTYSTPAHGVDVIAEIYVQKTDSSLTSYEMHLESPLSLQEMLQRRRNKVSDDLLDQLTPFKVTFDTPGSQIDRKMLFEVQLPSGNSERLREARLRIESPWKRILAQAVIRDEAKERSAKIQLSVDEQEYLTMELAIETIRRGQKLEYRPRLLIQADALLAAPIHLTGVWTYSRGRKTMLHMQLNDVTGKQQFLKGTFIRERTDKNSAIASRHSADVNLNLVGVKGRVAATLELADRLLKVDIASDYQLPSWTEKETAKVAFKLQNLSSGKSLKLVAFGALQASQFPQYQVKYQQNVLYAAGEKLECDLKLGWAQEEEQIRLYGVVKKSGQRGKVDLESTAIVVYRPGKVNYQLTGTAGLVGFGINGQKRYNLVVKGEDREDPDAPSAFKGEFAYSYLGKSPLSMKMRASLKSATVDFVYADEIEERASGHFHGQLLVQLAPEHKYSTEYVYKAVNSGEHQLEVTLKNARTQSTYRHHGLLKLEPSKRQWLLRSKLESDQTGDLFEGQLQYAPGQTQLSLKHIPSDVHLKANYDLLASPATGQFDLSTASLKHESSFELVPAQSWNFASKTKRNGESVLAIAGQHDGRSQHQRFSFSSKPFEGELQLDLPTDAHQTAAIRLEAPKVWSHETTLSRHAVRPYVTLDSRTHYHAAPLATLAAKYDPEVETYFTVSTPFGHSHLSTEMDSAERGTLRKAQLDLEAGKYAHHSKLAIAPSDASVDFTSNTKKSGQPLVSLRYTRSADNVHALSLDSPQLLKASGECKLAREAWSQPSAGKSYATIRIGDHLQSHLELEPYKSAQLKVACPEYDHLTTLTYLPNNQGKTNWKVNSSTVSLKDATQRYDFEAEHTAHRRSALSLAMPAFASQMDYQQPEESKEHRLTFELTGKDSQMPIKHRTFLQWRAPEEAGDKPTVSLVSGTISHEGHNLVNLNAAYHHKQPNTPSNLKVRLGESLSGNLQWSLFHPTDKSLVVEGEMTDARRNDRYQHKSQAHFHPHEGRLSVDSSTDRNGESIFKLDGLFSRQPTDKSYIHLNANKSLKVKAQVEPKEGRALLNFDLAPYEHRSEFTNEDGYRLASKTSRNQENVFDFDGHYKGANDLSHLKMNAGPADSALSTQLFLHPADKFAHLTVDSPKWKHDSLFRFNDQTESEQAPASLFATSTHYEDALLGQLNGRFRGLAGANEIECTLPKVYFKSLVDVPSRVSSFEVKHHRSGRHLLGSIAVNQSEDDSQRAFHFDFAWDMARNPASKVQLDMNSRRVIAANQGGATHDNLVVDFAAQYATNKIVFDFSLVPEQAMAHPIRLALAFVPLDATRLGESWKLVYTHAMDTPTAFTCNWDFTVGEQLEYSLKLKGDRSPGKFTFAAQTIAPGKEQLQVAFALSLGSRIAGQQYFLEATVAQGSTADKKYQLLCDLTKHLETRKLTGTVQVRLPDLHSHLATFTLDLAQRHFTVQLLNETTGKQFHLEASYAANLVHVKAFSDMAFFPKVDATARYIPGEELHASLDLDAERKFEMTSKYTGELSTLQFYVLTKVDSVYTPSVEFTAQGRKSPEEGNAQRSVSLSAKYNMLDVFRGQFQQQDVQRWTAEATLAAIGSAEKIVTSSIESAPGDVSNGESSSVYTVKMIPREHSRLEPFVARIEERRPVEANGFIRSIKVDLFSEPQQVKIASTEVLIKHQTWSEVPQLVQVSLQHVPSASHGSLHLSLHETVQEASSESLFDSHPRTAALRQQLASESQVRDQALLSWNGRSIGFALTNAQYGTGEQQATEHHLRLYSPVASGRVLEMRCAHQLTSEGFFLKQALRTDVARQPKPLYQTTVVAGTDAAGVYSATLELESFKFTRSPKALQLTVQPLTPLKPLDVSLRLDVGQSEKEALNIEARLLKKPSDMSNHIVEGTAAQANHTVHFSAKTADQSVLDFSIDGHLSDSSIGLLWRNLNRRGQYQQGYYQARFFGQDRFEVTLRQPANEYQIAGVYKRNAGKGAIPVVDMVVSKFVPKRQSLSASATGESVLVWENKVHLQAVGRCIRADIEDIATANANGQPSGMSRQVTLCIDQTRANLLSLDIDSVRNGEKTVELSARLDARSISQTLQLSLHWKPVYLRQLIGSLLQLKDAQKEAHLAEAITNHELVQELAHKYAVIVRKLAHDLAYEPLLKIVLQEIAPIAQELGLNEQVIRQWMATAGQPFERLWVYMSHYGAAWKRAYAEYNQQMKKYCTDSSTCTKGLSYLEAFRNSEEMSRLIAKPLVSLLQKSHRFVSQSHGKLLNHLPAYNWQQYVPQFAANFVRTTTGAVYTWTRQLIVDERSPLSGLVHHCESIMGQLFAGNSQLSTVNWQRVSSAVEQSVALLFSPSSWLDSGRVLFWDPVNGQLELQIKSPHQGHLSSPLLKESAAAERKNGSSYGTHYGINSYDRYDVESSSRVRPRRSLAELTYSLINGGATNGTTFKAPKMLQGVLDSQLKFEFVWVEQLLAKRESLLRNLAMTPMTPTNGNNGTSSSPVSECPISVKATSVFAKADALNLVLLKVHAGEESLVEVSLRTHHKASLTIALQDLHLTIDSDLHWSLARAPLQANDSIGIIGESIQLHFARSFLLNGTLGDAPTNTQIRLAISWTPGRKLVSLQAHLYLDPRLMRHSAASLDAVCATVASLGVSLGAREAPPANGTSELSFYSPEHASWKAFSTLHHAQVVENFADANGESETNATVSRVRDLTCSRWMLLNTIQPTEALLWLCRRVRDGCNLAAYFVDRQDLIRLPNQCLACALPKTSTATLSAQVTRFGSRRHVNAADLAQVVFLLDGTCHRTATSSPGASPQRLMHQLNRLSKAIEKEFRHRRVRTRFMILTSDAAGKYQLSWPDFERRFNYSRLLTTPTNGTATSGGGDAFMESTWPSKGRHSFDFLHVFPYPPGRTSRHFLLFDCIPGRNGTLSHTGTPTPPTSTTCQENEVDFSTARTMLLHSNSFLHIVSGLGFSRRPLSSPKMRRVIGIDWRQCIFDNETAITRTHGSTTLDTVSASLRRHILPNRDICHALALETNGSLFGHRVLKQANRRQLARRMAENHYGARSNTRTTSSSSSSKKEPPCYRCDCMLNKDRMSAHEECTLCRDRQQTLVNPYSSQGVTLGAGTPNLATLLEALNTTTASGTGDVDWQYDAKQEWTEEDEAHSGGHGEDTHADDDTQADD